MDKVKEYLGIFFGGRLAVEGNGRTFAKLPRPPKNVSAALAVLRRICYHSRCCPPGLCKDFAV